jgi:hypothetical protein
MLAEAQGVVDDLWLHSVLILECRASGATEDDRWSSHLSELGDYRGHEALRLEN